MIKWSNRGTLRLRQCRDYIAAESCDWATAWRWEDKVLESVEHLSDFPESGVVVRELCRNDIRQILLGDYRIIYRVKAQQCEIISVRHSRFLISSIHSL